MNKIFGILLIGLLLIGCKEKKSNRIKTVEKVELNKKLIHELSKMLEVDQLAASNAHPPENYSHFTQEEWVSYKDSIFIFHQKRIAKIIDKYGYPGYTLVGERGANIAFILVQHSDHNPKFQKDFLKLMKIEVENGNADSSNYALLTDRTNLNNGKAQVYGTQVTYNFNTGQAYPKELKDSINVNKRRKSIGLEPIEIYLNRMTEIHFEMNKQFYLEKGIAEQKLYITE